MTARSRRVATISVIISAIGLIAIYAAIDPATNHYPRCAFKTLTGLSCPGCGSQRALHALLNGDVREAVRLNALFIIEIPLIGLLLVSQLCENRAPKLRRILGARPFILLILATIIIWTVVRNILGI